MALSEWTGAAVDPGEGPPDPEEWTPVTVPGSPAAFAGADAVAYRTEFEDPRDGGDGRALLTLAGLYAHARVWLNGEHVASHDVYFEPLHVPFEPAPHNEVLVECRAPEDRFGGVHDTDRIPAGDRVPGIWWEASVEPQPRSFVADLRARPRVTADGTAIDVTAAVAAGEPLEDRLTLSLKPEGDFQSRGMMDRAKVAAGAGEVATVEHTVEVRDAALWWPRDLGPQHRYAVRAKLGESTETVTTGLCAVEYGEDGLLVNGEPLPARGVNLLSGEPADVERAVGANANLVRAHAHVPPEAVYRACSERGVLVWQDLPLTGPGGFDVERGRELAAALARRYGHHPSLAAFGVVDDPVDLFPERLGGGWLDRQRFRWRTWRAGYDAEPAEAVAEALPADRPAFPVVGSPGIDADATTLYPGWDYGRAGDVDWLLDRYPDLGSVVAEFGAGALAGSDPGETPGFDRETHDAVAPPDPEGSQAAQAATLKRVAEALRIRGADLLAAFALRDAGPAGMGVLARDGTEKAGYAALAASFEPVQAVLSDPSPGSTDVVVLNDTTNAVSGRLEWAAGPEAGGADVEVGPRDRTAVESLAVPGTADRVTLELALGGRTVRNAYYI